jgi:glycosyltransferase involved in cell wall biosynthesis
MKFNIITRCSRLQNLDIIKHTIFNKKYNIDWHIIFDTTTLKDIPAELLNELQNKNTFFYFVKGDGNDYLYPQAGNIIKKLEGWAVFIDDDTIMHDEYYDEISKLIDQHKTHQIFIVSQQVDGRDFTGLDIREATPENTCYQGVDIAQITFNCDVFNHYEFTGHHSADGFLIEKIYDKNSEWFYWYNKVLCYYNQLEKKSKPKLPKILLISDKCPSEFKSKVWYDYEDDNLDALCLPNDNNINQIIHLHNPDSIVCVSDDWTNFPNLASQPLQIRNKWITIPELNDWSGESAYQCAMTTMLNNDTSQLISYFTPVYNTGKVLYRTYESLKKQTYNNWEWVLVNDSTDGGKSLKIAEDIASQDSRVKVYDFREKSKGIIGEVKYRAASLCRGYILAELDHDDYLTSNCTELLFNASQKHPEVGFFYTDSAEINENHESLHYGPGFAFGYGRYESVHVDGITYDSCISPNINPKTIRHIVGVPNHVRAWRRDVYHQIGGHNRYLSVADDYELIIRTFLNTIMMRIPTLGYLQFIHSTNTTDVSRKDIQRRVRTIMYHYNDRIANRFEELGVEDYVYKENKDYPLNVESRFDDQENYVNLTYKI